MSVSGLTWLQRLSAIASLNDACRRALYAYVRNAGHAVGRDEAARAMALPRSTASFHLDRLVRDGLLRPEFRKTPDKAGPGSGRPAKLYTPVLDEVGASVPARQYDLAADLMAAAIEGSSDQGTPAAEVLMAVADAKGRKAGRPGDFLGVLADLGYEPAQDATGGYRLLNCPFHRLSQDHHAVVCSMNGSFLAGVAVASGRDTGAVVQDSGAGHCCARIAAETNVS
ncbi:transcriptional regulator [Arthrobacter sp. AK01]|uniref:helix-turn-helix transcriptional regulator n=1 Tax=Micrococcaceae TaxID=1268 RepID=UPI001E2D29E4|nr:MULTISPECIES: transcriptional regulator [Micrococcaceae]MCD4849255.1 transcriptional regulator [Arthrobacter sp. AK01]MCP1414739.1 putative ArsR family transcriptional regulator [Paenarthrobacter sp. A20]